MAQTIEVVDKTNKRTIINIFCVFRGKHEYVEDTKKKMLKDTNSTSKDKKIIPDGSNSRLDTAKENINEP